MIHDHVFEEGMFGTR